MNLSGLQNKLLVVFLIGGLFQPLSLRAAEETNREIVDTFVNYYVSQKQYDLAEARLKKHLEDDPKDSERWNSLGLVLMSLKRFTAATEAYAKAVETSPEKDKGVFLYNQAVAAHKLKNANEAVALLTESERYNNTFASARYALNHYRADMELPALRIRNKPKWSGGIGSQMGYDTNVLLVSAETLSALISSNTSSPNFKVSSHGEYHHEYYAHTVDVMADAAYSFYTVDAALPYNSLNGNLNFKWAPFQPERPLTWGLKNTTSISYMNTYSSGPVFYTWNDTLTYEGVYAFSGDSKIRFEIPVRFQRFNPPADADNEQTGIALGFKANQNNMIWGELFTGGLEFERAWAQGTNFKSYMVALPLSWIKGLPLWQLTSILGFRTAGTFYTESNTGRRDIVLNPTLVLGKGFKNKLGLNLSYGFTRSYSNVSTASYEKHTLMIGVDYGF